MHPRYRLVPLRMKRRVGRKDLIEAIIEGIEPDELSLEKRYRLPAAWEEQRREADIRTAGDV